MIQHHKYHGVFRYGLKWCAEIRYSNLYKRLGMFDTDQLAAEGYDKMVLKLQLDDVLPLNFPPEPELSLSTTILWPPMGLGTLALAIRQARAAQGISIIKFPMIPNLLTSKTIFNQFRLFSLKVLEAPVYHLVTGSVVGSIIMNSHSSNKVLYNG